MGFEQALSGLNVASQNLDVIGNNVANANTVGFKVGAAQFADVFAASLSVGGGGATQAGLGARVVGIAQQFTQGNLTTTGNPLDLAINGNGFFEVSAVGSKAISYTRNGQFSLDANNNLVNSTGLQVQGNTLSASGTVTSIGPVAIPSVAGAPVATGQSGLTSAGVQAMVNLNSGDAVIDPTVYPFSANTPASYNFSTPATVYDSQGNAHNLTMYFVKSDPAVTANTWTMHAMMPDVGPATTPPTWDEVGTAGGDTLHFKTDGTLLDVNGNPGGAVPLNSIQITGPAGATTPSVVSANVDPLSFFLTLTGSTQFAASDSINSLAQDGAATGRLASYNVGTNGIIQATYSNGQTKDIAQLLLSTFNNPQGLQALGNNLWAATAKSGAPSTNPPGVGNNGVLQSGATEDSNVNLTTQLVDMITAQRAYQANAQTIKTMDQVLQTLVSMR